MSVEVRGRLIFDAEHVWWISDDISCELFRPGQNGRDVADTLAHICNSHAANQRFQSTSTRAAAEAAHQQEGE